jgi:O-antigen ligase
MTRRLRSLALPSFLLLCLVAGGSSSQGALANAALQLVAVLILAWAAVAARPEPLARPGRLLLLLAIASIALIILQLVPLPPGLWSSLPDREPVVDGYEMLGYPLPSLPLSVAPYQTLASSYSLLPPLGVLAGIIVLRAHRESWLAGAVILGAMASVFLGALQVAGGGQAGWTYLYEITNTGAVGLFANRNHMATLLLAAIPFTAAVFASGHPRIKGRGAGFATVALGGGGFLLLIVGLVLNRSLAAAALAVPVIAFSAVILPAGWRLRRALLPLALLALAAAVVAMSSSSVRSLSQTDIGAFTSRTEMWENTSATIAETFPFGTGLGTFSQIYASGENPANIAPTYINHAHNDYLELLLETGAPGLILIMLFLGWWAWAALRVWRSPSSTPFARAATVASAAILAHSIVDFPLRTSAIAALLAACVGTMAQPPRERRSERAKHVDIA